MCHGNNKESLSLNIYVESTFYKRERSFKTARYPCIISINDVATTVRLHAKGRIRPLPHIVHKNKFKMHHRSKRKS